MKEKISVIIPIYNREKNILKCLDSVFNQNYDNVEIVLIDDGSTDNTAKICKEAKVQHKNIEYFFQKNSGVSVARNTGVEKSTGEYIVFIDSDDYLDYDFLTNLINAIKSGDYDFACCQFKKVDDDGKIIFNSKEPRYGEILQEEALEMLYTNNFSISCCGKIYKKEFLCKNRIKFEPNIKNNEDKLFIFNCIKNMNKCYVIDYCGYNYYDNNNSASNKLDCKSFDDMLYVSNLINDCSVNSKFSNIPISLTCLEICRTIIKNGSFISKWGYLKKIQKKLKKDCNYKLINNRKRIFELNLLHFSLILYVVFTKLYNNFKKFI